ncbi:MAG: hemolysin family protein, partial [Planctomycetota bacterium]
MTTTWIIVFTTFAGLLSLFASSLHFALRDFSVRKLEDIAGRNGGMGKLESIVDNADHHALSMGALRSIAVAAMIVGITLLFDKGSTDDGVLWMWVVVAIAVSAASMYLVTVLLPASLADHIGESLIHKCSAIIKLVHLVFLPLRWLLVVDSAVKFLAGTHTVTEQEEVEDEILSAATEGEREGSLGEAEKGMIESVLDMRNKDAQEIMTPRTEMETLPVESTLEEVRAFIEQAGHSRIPVYEGDHDHIVGILYAKDLLQLLGKHTNDFDLRSILRPAVFVPEAKPAADLLVDLQQMNVHMAIVLDEYGGTTGLVTLEDILEEIVGEIRDEYEPEDQQEPMVQINGDERTADIEARATISDANRALEDIEI